MPDVLVDLLIAVSNSHAPIWCLVGIGDVRQPLPAYVAGLWPIVAAIEVAGLSEPSGREAAVVLRLARGWTGTLERLRDAAVAVALEPPTVETGREVSQA